MYRGTKFAGLAGGYIYGDHSTGQIWAAKQEDGKLVSDTQIARTRLGITNFCETPQGDLLVVDYLGNAIHKLERNIITPTATRPPFPTKLGETGLFTDTAALKPHPGLIRYEINAAGWHDGAACERLIALPPGGRMEFTEQGGWNLTDGSAIVQTLTAGRKRIETRVLLRQENEWAGYSYAWNDEQTDAVLVEKEGATRDGWRFPSRSECALCHSRQANFLLGISTLQLNRQGVDGENQIVKWEREGLIAFNHAALEESEWRSEFEKLKLGDAELRRIGHLREQDLRVASELAVIVHERRDAVGDHIVAEVHHERLTLQKRLGNEHRVREAARGVLLDVGHAGAEPGPVAQGRLDLLAGVPDDDADVLDARRHDRLDPVEKHRLVGDRDELLGARVGQRTQARPLAAGQDEALHWDGIIPEGEPTRPVPGPRERLSRPTIDRAGHAVDVCRHRPIRAPSPSRLRRSTCPARARNPAHALDVSLGIRALAAPTLAQLYLGLGQDAAEGGHPDYRLEFGWNSVLNPSYLQVLSPAGSWTLVSGSRFS